jgi:hypothetical protein
MRSPTMQLVTAVSPVNASMMPGTPCERRKMTPATAPKAQQPLALRIPGTLQGDPLVSAWSLCLARDTTVGHCRVANLPGGP